jgi:uncharacterized membrane protein
MAIQGGFVALLIGGLILFIGIHILPNFTTARAALAAKLGENGYKLLFSVVSVIGLVLIVLGYRQAPLDQVFEPSHTAQVFLPAAMAVAFVLLAVANVPGRIRHAMRHPMLTGILIWAVFHLLANGDLASNILFGTFSLWAVFAILSVEYRGKRPGGKGSLKADLAGAVVGLLLYAVVLYYHEELFGVPPM